MVISMHYTLTDHQNKQLIDHDKILDSEDDERTPEEIREDHEEWKLEGRM